MAVAGDITPQEFDEVDHLVGHGEPAEGLRTLAWILGDGHKKVPVEVVTALRELTAGLIEEAHMPPDLDECKDLSHGQRTGAVGAASP